MSVGSSGGVNSVGVKGRKKYFFPPAVPSTTPTHGHFVLSPVSLAPRDQDGGPSNTTIDIYDLTGKKGTVNSLLVFYFRSRSIPLLFKTKEFAPVKKLSIVTRIVKFAL